MTTSRRTATSGMPVEPYSAPELQVHGTVTDLTAGTIGGEPEASPAGSFIPPDDSIEE